MMRLRFWQRLFFSADGGAGGGAPPAAAPAPAAAAAPGLVAAAQKASEGAPPAQQGDPAKPAEAGKQPDPAKAGDPPKPYFPDGLPETLRGTNERETLDNIAKELGSRPKAPEKPDGYELKLPEAVAKKLGDLSEDPMLPKFREICHRLGLPNEAFNAVIGDTYAAMEELGLIDTPENIAKELAKLEPASGDPQQKKSTAAQRVNSAINWVTAQQTRGNLARDEAAALIGVAKDAAGVRAIEKLMKMGGEHGLQTGGAPPAGADTMEGLKRMMQDPRYDLRGPKGDPQFVADVDARWRRLHGAS